MNSAPAVIALATAYTMDKRKENAAAVDVKVKLKLIGGTGVSSRTAFAASARKKN